MTALTTTGRAQPVERTAASPRSSGWIEAVLAHPTVSAPAAHLSAVN
ncbi:hypothetical protein [Streptomyces sp. NPDC001678]